MPVVNVWTEPLEDMVEVESAGELERRLDKVWPSGFGEYNE